ncbi:alpha/beta hydrolase [Undibacterium sp. TS12]|uniref:alpha/beta fold hydrolase n=1 Tax=Undibacterium sp. TS12 TaxID=2908202 RepID=UPI001F4C5A43|nr:alpha/beta hydrolase [Undibacterium sp. TS12]MCH8618893.1 alpha/beta hydrolase [Undibacterium sp. TS12]
MSELTVKPIIHFVHGNSFPSGTYRAFLDHLRTDFEVFTTDMVGHNPAYPVTDGWRHLVQELIDTLQGGYQQPVILVGHSLGGILSLMAARARPDLVRAVVVLDSPVVAGWRAFLLRTFKFFGWDRKFSPARFSAKRRHIWKDEEEAYQHFAAKEMFAIWPPEVLRDYMKAGLKPHPEGVTLRFTREVETAIYRSLPHGLGRLNVRRPAMPVGFVGGTESIECRQAGDKATRKLMGDNYVLIPGGHLIPMETPVASAIAVREMIARFRLS